MADGTVISAGIEVKTVEDQALTDDREEHCDARPYRRASKMNQIIDLDEQNLQRMGTSEALDLSGHVDLQDPTTKELRCPVRGRVNVDFAEVVQIPDAHLPVKSQLQMERLISSGSFSKVYRGSLRQMSVAVKCISTNTLKSSCIETMYDTQIKMADKLLHRNILGVECVVQDQKTVYLVMHDLTGGDLFDLIASLQQKNEKMTGKVAARYIWHMISGIAYLHSLNLCHRDIRPENYMLSHKSPDAELKLIDFSLARQCEDSQEMNTLVGCLNYVAPEVINGPYTNKCDVWSVGIVAFLICCQQLPIYDTSPEKLVKRVASADIAWKHTSRLDSNFQAILQKMLMKYPQARSTSAMLTKNEWLRKEALDLSDNGRCCAVS